MVEELHILIVEDAIADFELTMRELNKGEFNFSARRVETKEDFIKEIENFAPNLILSDNTLPSFDGLTALSIAREKCPDIPFIFVTGTMGEEIAIETLKKGATDYVIKNRISRLIPSVKRALEEMLERVNRKQLEVDKKKAEEALKKSEEKIRKIFDLTPEAVSVFNLDGKIVECNQSTLNIFGFADKDEIIGRDFLKFIPQKDQCKKSKYIEESLEQDIIRNIERSLLTKDGNEFPVEITTGVIKDSSGNPQYLIAVIRDITERKKMEQMVIQSEKMASLGTIAAGVAHEINNPIGYIGSNLRTLHKYQQKFVDYFTRLQEIINSNSEKGLIDSKSLCEVVNNLSGEYKINFILDDLKAALEESIEGTEKVKKIISNLRDFSRMEKAQMNYANINDGIEKTLNVIWNELKYKAEVIKEYGDIPEIECDIHQLNQVFMNILVNASHAIQERGIIKIKTFKANDCVIIQFSDTGSGIPKEILNKIFDAFFTTKEPGKGTGLGLSIAYKIIHEHNGIIDVESEVGKGTTFTIKLPTQHSQKIKEIKVLIVDDEEDFCILMKEMIIPYNPLMSIKIAVNGFEAADLLNTFKPDIVLLDITMPGMDGFEICKKIKSNEHTKDTKVIMITGDMREGLREKSLELGAFKFLKKPIKSKILFEIFDKIINPINT